MSAASRSLVIATTYVTEACARQSLAAPEGTPATLLYNYVDQAYGRSSYCVGGAPRAVAETVVALATDAIARVDVRAAAGTHPQIGAVDHVAVNPLGDDLETAAATANATRWPARPPRTTHPRRVRAACPTPRRSCGARAIGDAGATGLPAPACSPLREQGGRECRLRSCGAV